MGLKGPLQVVNTPGGAVVTNQQGQLVKVGNANFTTSTPVEVFGSDSSATAAAGSTVLYAVDEITGQIQQLDDSTAQLTPVGPLISVHARVTTPVVAPDGSLYVAVPSTGSVGHVADGRLVTIKGVGRPGSELDVVLAGSLPVAADLTSGTLAGLGPAEVSGRVVHLPDSFHPAQVAGSDIDTGLVGLASDGTVMSVDVPTGATSVTTLPFRGVRPSDAAMQGRILVLIDGAHKDVLIVNTATRHVRRVTMPRGSVPNQLIVQDRLVFVNASDGPSAPVISGYNKVTPVTKYTKPPVQHPKPAVVPSVHKARPTVHRGPPRKPGAPQDPVATPGNATVTVGWGAAPANGSAIQTYEVAWRSSNGSTGHTAVTGRKLGTVVNNLSNGVPYVFTVTATNGIGTGPPARTAQVRPSSQVPDAPARPTATTPQADGSVTLQWPTDDNGFRIASYTVWQVGDQVLLLTNVKVTSATVGPAQGLVAGTPVQFEISAVGASGATGAQSVPSAQVTPYLPPGAPTVTATPAQAVDVGDLAGDLPRGLPERAAPRHLPGDGGRDCRAGARGLQRHDDRDATGLTPETVYTAEVTVTDTAGATGTAAAVPVATDGLLDRVRGDGDRQRAGRERDRERERRGAGHHLPGRRGRGQPGPSHLRWHDHGQRADVQHLVRGDVLRDEPGRHHHGSRRHRE